MGRRQTREMRRKSIRTGRKEDEAEKKEGRVGKKGVHKGELSAGRKREQAR